MKINRALAAFLAFSMIFSAFLLNSCKDESTVEPPPPNNQNPNTPQLIEPSNNGTINNFSPLLKWQSYENASGYAVQMSLDANFISHLYVDTVTASTELNFSNLPLNTNVNYYWRVKANLQAGGSSGWSAVWRFHIILLPPEVPVPLLPPDNSVDQSYIPLFDWSDSPTAQYYRLQVSETPGFPAILLDLSQISNSQIQCPPLYLTTGTLYYWRVNASNSNGESISDWSQVFSFRTINGIPPYSIGGTVRFADTNFAPLPTKYFIAAYRRDQWPPSGEFPIGIDSLHIIWENNEYVAHYRIRNLVDNSYCIGVYSQSTSIANDIIFRGTYGCDTNRVIYSDCPVVSPGTVIITGGAGIENINILSWADTSKSIF